MSKTIFLWFLSETSTSTAQSQFLPNNRNNQWQSSAITNETFNSNRYFISFNFSFFFWDLFTHKHTENVYTQNGHSFKLTLNWHFMESCILLRWLLFSNQFKTKAFQIFLYFFFFFHITHTRSYLYRFLPINDTPSPFIVPNNLMV